MSLEGLNHLAKDMADEELSERHRAPRGLQRRRPRTKNFFVIEGLNYVFEHYGMPKFCVQEAATVPGRVPDLLLPHEAGVSSSPMLFYTRSDVPSDSTAVPKRSIASTLTRVE